LLIKMLRLARLLRLVRLLRFKMFAELRMIVQGVFAGIRVFGWAIVLLFFVIFLLGIVFRILVGDSEPEFSSLPKSMFTLFRCFTDGCDSYQGTPLTERLAAKWGSVFVAPYALVYLFVTFGIFNMIMAVFIDNVANEQHLRKLREIGESSVRTRTRLQRIFKKLFKGEITTPGGVKLKERFMNYFLELPIVKTVLEDVRKSRSNSKSSLDFQNERLDSVRSEPSISGSVSREEFNAWLEDEALTALLDEMDIQMASKYEIFDALDVNMNGDLELTEVIDGLMKLRGQMTKSDIVAIRMKVRYITGVITDWAESTDHTL